MTTITNKMTAQPTASAASQTVSTSVHQKPAYVMGFEPGDLIALIRPLHPVSGLGPIIPSRQVGRVEGVTLNTITVSFLFYGTRVINPDDAEYVPDYHLEASRLS